MADEQRNQEEEGTGGCLTGAGDAPKVVEGPLKLEIMEEEVNPFVRLLQNELVTDKLLSLFSVEDMKTLSAVSTGCLKAVRQTAEFTKRARFIICKEVVSSQILEDTVYPPLRNLSLDLSLPIEIVALIEDILHSAQYITLRLPEGKDVAEMEHYLSEILKRATNLKSIELDALIFKYILHDTFSDVGVQTMLTNLKCLAIQSNCDKPKSICYIDGSEDDEDIPFQRNFLQLSLLPLNLTKFVFGKVLTISGSESDHLKFIPRIIEATKNTLEDLELHLNVWKFDEMTGIRCPKLKRLVLSANGSERDPKVVKTFLKNQPPLKELVIEMKVKFPFSILQILQGMLTKMKKLHIKAKVFSETTSVMDWSFLGSMSELKDFRIRKPTSFANTSAGMYGYGEEILAKLPIHTERISIQGFDPFWKEVYPVIGNVGVLLGHFENLKEINLLRSSNAVTDEALQSIITTCRKLASLTFSHCPEVTDFGISGIRKSEDGIEETVGVSLTDLKGLVRLKIRSCANISTDCLLQVVQFQFLRFFDYYRNVVLPKQFLLQIARQNPLLEEVALHITNYENDADYVRDLKREVKEISPRLHLLEILEQSNWEDEDSDSDASSIKEDGDSDFSGGGYHMHRHDDYDFDDDFDDSPDYFDDVDEDDDDGIGFYG